MKFIKLTVRNDNSLFLNPCCIESITKHWDPDDTAIYTIGSQECYLVKESIQEVLALLDEVS